MASTFSTRSLLAISGLLLGAAVALAVTFLGGPVNGQAAVGSSAVPKTIRPAAEGLRVKTYGSIQQLTADAEIILVARATTVRSIERIQTIPFSVTEMEAVAVWKGTLTASTRFKLRQDGDGATASEVPVVTAGRTYLVFIKRFTFGPGRETDQFVVVGAGAGLYAIEGPLATRLDPLSRDLPDRVLVTKLRDEVRSARPN